jgi:hypothetical protein
MNLKFKQGDKVLIKGFYSKKFPYGGIIRNYTLRVDGTPWYFVDVLRNPLSIFRIFSKTTFDDELLPEKCLGRVKNDNY